MQPVQPGFRLWVRVAVALGVVAVSLVLGPFTGRAQTTTNTASTENLKAQLRSRLAAAQAECDRVGAAGIATNLPVGATPGEALEYQYALQSSVRIYQRHLDELAALAAARQKQQDLEQTIKSWTGFAEPPPYSILLVDELRGTIQSLTDNITSTETALTILQRLASDAQTDIQNSDGRLRRLDEELESASERTDLVRLTWQRTLEQAKNRRAAAEAAFTETQQNRSKIELAIARQRLAFVQRQLAVAAQQVRFPQADLDKVMADLDVSSRQTSVQYQGAVTDGATREAQLTTAREELRRALAANASSATNAPGADAEVKRLQELVLVRGAQAETSALCVQVLGEQADFLSAERSLWQMRFAVFHTDDLAKLQEAYRRLDRLSSLVQMGRAFFAQQVELAAQQIADQQNRMRQRTGAPPGDSGLSQELMATHQQREELFQRALRRLDSMDQIIRRWKESLDQDREALPFTGRLRDLFTQFSTFASKFWRFELYVAEDTVTVDGQPITGRRSVTVGKVIMAVLILVAGYLLARTASRAVERLVVKRLKAEPNQASLISRWVMVVLLLCLIIFSLVSVKIPLTVFAFAGGALAIGVGFGTQNLLKNFISGIIILFERPFRVGDVLDVGGRRGTVTGIGIRSSVLLLWDGTETLIPNSELLENNLTNWTYSNRSVRFTVAVGVAYGSDTRRVAQLLAEVAGRHGQVEADPKPQIFFVDFGASTLNFELRCWVDVLKHNAAQIGSDLRHMIAGAFAENGIVIAFPQQDVHLDAARPLPVQVVSPTGATPPAEPSARPPAV